MKVIGNNLLLYNLKQQWAKLSEIFLIFLIILKTLRPSSLLVG